MTTIDADRWLEIDLYWFDNVDLAGSVMGFWNRFAPLIHGVDGWRGVIVNSGWLADQVLDWRGDLDEPIPFPSGLGKDKFFPDNSPLLGTEEQRRAGWHARFDERGERNTDGYQRWTYRQLGELAELLRRVAADAFGIEGVRIGTFVIGWDSIYACEPSAWSKRHPEAFFKGSWVDRLFNVIARLDADPIATAAFPDGIEQGLPISRFFGQQWGHLSKSVGLDAIVLRDSMIGQGIYERLGPWGAKAPADPALVAEWGDATAALVRETKLAAPEALVIGYSNAASAVADWRVNCVDLESIAHEGYLDAWIDQTWAGAWNEVGQREDLFWNLPLQGWTNQLGFVLLRAAALAGSPVRHYVLTETFDAWESWDIIHTAPERLRWGIWAYLHAFIKTPDGLTAPRGTYISWLNQGNRLLTEGDVAFLAESINAATADARDTTEVFGPTAVYSRAAMEWQTANAPEADIKEWIDEQIGFLAKFGVPVSSVTRAEHLSSVDSDYLIVQTPNHLPEAQIERILERIDAGLPTMVTGNPGGGFDPRIAAAVGLSGDGDRAGERKTTAARGAIVGDDIPAEFATVHPSSINHAADHVDVLYSVDGSPALVRSGSVAAWDPADVQHRVIVYSGQWDFGSHNPDQSVRDLMGSAYPFLIPAREINRVLAEHAAVSVADVAADSPVAVAAWRTSAGVRVLVGEVEEGFRTTTDGTWPVTVRVPHLSATVQTDLTYGQSRLFTVTAEGVAASWG
ncbi:hypothetical protein [uncultured Amnibacterium sp.]|uniref:hypothetical protein n=1 Tax=uncultured Amnibacterium sp. TaxID=1631851 RepID=UPI0035CA33DA